MSAEIIVIDLWSVIPALARTGSLSGQPVPGLVDYVRSEQSKGSTVYFIAGNAYDPFWRQGIERYLELAGIRSTFVTHGLPDGFTVFISSKAFLFDGKQFPK